MRDYMGIGAPRFLAGSSVSAHLEAAMVTFDGGDQCLDLQNEFIGIKEWTCDPSSLGLTPKEIEKRLNSTPSSISSC